MLQSGFIPMGLDLPPASNLTIPLGPDDRLRTACQTGLRRMTLGCGPFRRQAMRTVLTAVIISLTAGVTLSAQQPANTPAWDITLGGGAVLTPSYAGAAEHQVFPFPMTQVSYRNRVYLGQSSTGNGLGLGVVVVRTSGLAFATEIGFLQNRPASRADALAGMENRSFVATASGSLGYSIGGFEAGISATKGMNDGAGLLGSARLSFTQTIGPRISATGGVGATFANARQMRWDFGVTQAEASRRQALIDAGDDRLERGDGSAFQPDGGLRHIGASLSLVCAVSSHWALLGFAGVDRLSDEAARSPLVRRREQVSGGLGLGYRF